MTTRKGPTQVSLQVISKMLLIQLVIVHSLSLKCQAADVQEALVLESQVVELPCNCSPETGKWQFNGRPLYTNQVSAVALRQNVKLKSKYALEISNVTLSDEGIYRCKCNDSDVSVFNLSLSVVPTLVFHLDSRYIPYETQDPIHLTIKKNNNVTLSCTAMKGRPTAKIVWRVDGGKIIFHSKEVKTNPEKIYTTDSKSQIIFQPRSTKVNITCSASGAQGTNRSLQLFLSYYTEKQKEGLKWTFILGITTLATSICGVSFLLYKHKKCGKHEKTSPSDIAEVQVGCTLQTVQHQTQIGNNDLFVTMKTNLDLRDVRLETKLPGKGMMKYCTAVVVSKDGQNERCVARSISEQAQMVDLYSFKELAKCLVTLESNKNVVNTMGVKIDDVPYYICQEYITCGNLKDFMMGNYQKRRNTVRKPLPTGLTNTTLKDNRLQLSTFALDICNAMVFLAQQNYVHPALSSRKVLLTENCCCKLYDFWPVSLSSERVRQILKQKPPPVAWCAPETIFLGNCTKESDVWSFAVVLWEVFSLGETPYVGISCEEIELRIRSGRNLDQPHSCPGGLYDIMLSSWNNTVSMRPTMKDVRSKLSSCMQAMQTLHSQMDYSVNELPSYHTLKEECLPDYSI